jgi:cell division protein FtsB
MKKPVIRQILLILSVGFVVADSLFWGKGIPKIFRLKRKLNRIQSRIEVIKKENIVLEAAIEKLRSNPLTIETIAREELGMARPGEIIYQLPIERNSRK